MDPRTVPPPLANLPLFSRREVVIWDPLIGSKGQEIGRLPTGKIIIEEPLSPLAHGRAGASDAEKHLKEHAPSWVLTALGDALLSYAHRDFTSEDIRVRAEQSEAVRGWLAAKGRENCFPGWWRSRVRLHKLQRTGRDEIAMRSDRRGARLPFWRFPVPLPESTTNG